MRNLSFKAALFAALSVLGLSSAHAQFMYPSGPVPYSGAAPWAEAWAGFGVQNNWYGGWGGFNYAFNHNAYSSGFLLRAEGGGGHYDYNQSPTLSSLPGTPNGQVNVTYGTGSVLLGYRAVLQNVIGQSTVLSGYIGAEVQNHDNPDPNADLRGTEWGVKVLGDVYERWNAYQDFYGMASFSSAFDTWMLVARPGFLVTSPESFQVWIGPDMSIFADGHAWAHSTSAECPHNSSGGIGSCHYEQGKIGAFAHFVSPGWTILGDVLVSGGYQQPMASNNGPHGYYAQIGLYWPIR